jgi:hypothetical protein
MEMPTCIKRRPKGQLPPVGHKFLAVVCIPYVWMKESWLLRDGVGVSSVAFKQYTTWARISSKTDGQTRSCLINALES